VSVIEPLIPEEYRDLPVWECWLKHVLYLQVIHQRTMSRPQVDRLDHLIYDHQCAFLKVAEYEGFWKPKHHFLQHTRADILRYGPPRYVWCMAFESFNQEIKAIASRSNFKNVLETVGRFWIDKSGRALQKGAAEDWSAATVCVTAEFEDLAEAAAISPLIKHCLDMFQPGDVRATRTICSVELHGDNISENDWVLCTSSHEHDEHAPPRLLRVVEMAEMVTDADSILFVRGESKAVPPLDICRGGQLCMLAGEFEALGEEVAFCLGDVELIPVHITRQASGASYVVQMLF